MKRMILFFAVTFCLVLAACGQTAEEGRPTTVQNDREGIALSLGMTREDVEKNLEKGGFESVLDGESDGVVGVLYDGPERDEIWIKYRDDQIISMEVQAENVSFPTDSVWTLGDIPLGTTREEVVAAFGEPTGALKGELEETPNQMVTLYYNYDGEGKLLTEEDASVTQQVIVSLDHNVLTYYYLGAEL